MISLRKWSDDANTRMVVEQLTHEMVMVMGGDINTEAFAFFSELTVRAYLAARPYEADIVALVALMLDTGFPCFRKADLKVLQSLRMRFQVRDCVMV